MRKKEIRLAWDEETLGAVPRYPTIFANVACGVKVSITDCDSVGEGSIPFEQHKNFQTLC